MAGQTLTPEGSFLAGPRTHTLGHKRKLRGVP